MLRWTVHLEGSRIHLPAAVAVGHKVYSFGGYRDKIKGQIEVHVFNTVSLDWRTLPPVTTGREPGCPPLEVPSMRYGHTTALIGDIVYIWGGYNYTMNEYCNMLYAFEVNTHRWFEPEVSGAVPGAKSAHSACVLGKAMYIFGGYNKQTRYTNDIYKLDTTTIVWSLINTSGTPAPYSLCHSATIIGTKMFVFGGRGEQGEDHYNNIKVFDTETNCWLSTPSAQPLPEGRGGHSAFVYNGELYLFSGHNFQLDQTFNDLWKFNPETFSWKKVEQKGKGPCWMYRMCYCVVGDCVILFGGYTPDDLYILDLNPSLKTLSKLAVIQHGLEKSELPHDIRWELAAMTSNSNRKKEQPSKNR